MKLISLCFGWLLGLLGMSSWGMEEQTVYKNIETRQKLTHQVFITPKTFLEMDKDTFPHGKIIKVAIIDYDFDYYDEDIFPKLSPSYQKAASLFSEQEIDHHRKSLSNNDISSHGTMMAHLLTGRQGLVDNVMLCPIALNFYKDLHQACRIALNTKADFVTISLPLHDGHDYPMDGYLQARLEKLAHHGVGVIISAGNHKIRIGDTPYSQSLVDVARRMKGHMLLVGGTSYGQSKGGIWIERLSSFSNRAGDAWRYFITAPATIAKVCGVQGEEINNVMGTSYGAPIVTAVAVALKGMFPGLTNHKVLKIIRHSARKCFYEHKEFGGDLLQEADPQVYGNGMVDFKAALALALKLSKNKAPDDL